MEDKVKLYHQAAQALRQANFALALTGAGISVPSGIPDFRSPGGLWSKFDPQAVASQWALENNPKEVWEFLLEAQKVIVPAQPNPAHYGLARLEEMGLLHAIITQNIDGLHQKAGSRQVIEFHGGYGRFYCHECGQEHDPETAFQLTRADIPWMCRKCFGLVRPDVVFFGEQIPEHALSETKNLIPKTDLVMIVGTSGEVAPAGTLPRWIREQGGTVMEINLGETYFQGITDIRLDEPAETALPGIIDAL